MSRKYLRLLQNICLLALALMVIVIAGMRMQTKAVAASKQDTSAQIADVKDGLYKGTDGYYYYYDNGKLVKKTGWVLVRDTLKVKLDSKYRVLYKMSGDIYTYPNQKSQFIGRFVSVYDKSTGKFVGVKSDVVRLDDNQMYYINSIGAIFESVDTNISDGKGNIYMLRSYNYCGEHRDQARSVVKGKMVKKGNIIRYYTYLPDTDNWCMAKNMYKNISGVTYYFNSRGIAVQKIVTGTGLGKSEKLYIYSNSQWKTVKNKVVSFPMTITTMEERKDGRLRGYDKNKDQTYYIPNRMSAKNNKLYFFMNDGTKATCSKWYNASDGTKVYVCSKGYVTKKYNMKTKMIYLYNYTSKKWVAVTGKVYKEKIGLTTYYFDKNGKVYKTYRSKHKHTWDVYEENEKEIQICNTCGKDVTDMGSVAHAMASGLYHYMVGNTSLWEPRCPSAWHGAGATESTLWICYDCGAKITTEYNRKPTIKDY